MTIKLTRIVAVVSLAAGLAVSVAFGAVGSTTTAQPANQTGTNPSGTSTAPTPSTSQPTGTNSPATPTVPSSNAPAPSATPMTTPPVNNNPATNIPAPTAPTTPPPNTAAPSAPSATPMTTPENKPTNIYVNPANTGNAPGGAPVVNGASTTATPATGNVTETNTNVAPAAGAVINPTTTTQQQTAVIPQINLIDFSQKAATAAFSYDYKNYKQSLETMKTYFTKTGWESFNKALIASNNLDVVQKEKLSVTAALNGQAEVTQHQQTATGQTWQVNVPIIVTYQNDKKQTVQQDLIVKLVISTVNTNENPNGMGITQFIAMPNIVPGAATPAS